MTAPPRYRELEEEIEKVRKDKEDAIETQEFEKAASPARQGAEALAEEARARGVLARRGERGAAGDRRGGDRRHRLDVDGHPGLQADRGRDPEADPDGGRAAQARDRPARGDRRRLQVDPPRARRDQGPEAPDRLVHLPRPLRRGEDRARAHARRVPVRRRGRADPGRHVRVHGEALGLAARRLAARLHRLRRGRPADRGRAPQAVLGRPARRDREGAPGRLQHPAADPRGREADRRAGPQGRLPEHDRDHDLEHRRGLDLEEPDARLLDRRRERALVRRHEGAA